MVLSVVLNSKPWAPGTSKGFTTFWRKYAHLYYITTKCLSIYLFICCMKYLSAWYFLKVQSVCMINVWCVLLANFIVLVAEGCYAGIDTMFVIFFGFLLKGSLRLFFIMHNSICHHLILHCDILSSPIIIFSTSWCYG